MHTHSLPLPPSLPLPCVVISSQLKRVANQTKGGKKRTVSALVVVGNKQGAAGDHSTAEEHKKHCHSITQAFAHCVLNAVNGCCETILSVSHTHTPHTHTHTHTTHTHTHQVLLLGKQTLLLTLYGRSSISSAGTVNTVYKMLAVICDTLGQKQGSKLPPICASL